MPVKIFDFKGTRPRVTPRLLPLGYAQVASNVRLGSGAMECFNSLGTAAGAGSQRTLFKLDGTWLTWATRRWVEKAAISGVDKVLVADGNTSNYPITQTKAGVTRRWGVVRPTSGSALEVHFGEAPEMAEDAEVADTVSYVYTLVTEDGEESAPSDPTAFFDVLEGQYIGLSNFLVNAVNDTVSGAWYAATGNLISSVRVYRLNSDAAGNAEYQRVMLRSSASGAQVDDIPVASISNTDNVWYDADATQTGLSQNLGAMIVTEGWDPPPDGLKGACMFSNGMYAGFIGNVLYLSVPGYYYAMPASGNMDYTMELAYDGVAMAAVNEMLVVGTTGYPEIISGTDAAFMTRKPLPFQQPCLSDKGIVGLPDGVAYVSPDGLFFVSSAGGAVMTKEIMDRETWQTYDLADAILSYHNGRIFIFFEGDDTGLIYDPALDYLVSIDLPVNVYDAFVDPEADILYLATSAGIQAWGGGTGNLTAEWESGIMEMPPVNFSGCRVEGYFPNSSTTTLTYTVDTTPIARMVIAVDASGVVTRTITSFLPEPDTTHIQENAQADAPFRLPSGFRGRDHEIRVVFSGSIINAVYLAFDFGDFANV